MATILRLTTVIAALLVIGANNDAGAQAARYGGFEMSLGLSFTRSASDYVGDAPARHLRVMAGQNIGAGFAGGIRFDAFMMDAAEAQPNCAIPEGSTLLPPCDAQTLRPGWLLGLMLEGRWYPWQNGLGLSGGAGALYAPSVHGDVPDSGGALSGGVEYQLFSASSGIRPVVGVRGTRLLRDVGGIRWTLSPTVGLRF